MAVSIYASCWLQISRGNTWVYYSASWWQVYDTRQSTLAYASVRGPKTLTMSLTLYSAKDTVG